MGYTEGQRQGEWEGKGVPSNPTRRSLRKGLWSPDEDKKLTNYIMRNGLMGCWNYVARQAGLQRCGKSCRLRWINYLRPGLKRCAISPQEERLIIQLQSSLGNSRCLDEVCTTMFTRWSQIAAHLPGRTDNEIKNYWNSAIKKKLMLKKHCPSSSTVANGDANIKPSFLFQSGRITHDDSVHEAVTLSHSALPDLEVMPLEGYQRHNSTFNILFTTGENQVCAREFLELKQKTEDHNDDFLINPNPIHTTTIPPGGVCGSVNNYFLDSARFSIPALCEIQSSKEKIENDRQIIEKDTMMDCLSLTASSRISAWSAAHSNSNIAGDITDVISGVCYTNGLLGTGVQEDIVSAHHEMTASQSWQPLNLVAQVCGPLINNLDDEIELMDRPNLSYEVPTYADMNSSWDNNYKIGGGGIGDQQYCSRFPTEKPNTKPIPAIFGGESGALGIHEYYEGGSVQVPVWAQDNMCGINTGASDPHQIYPC